MSNELPKVGTPIKTPSLKPCLVIYHAQSDYPDFVGRVYELQPQATKVGPSLQSDIPLYGKDNPNYDVQVYQDHEGNWHLKNRKEFNNVAVNGILARNRQLYDGDRIEMGPVVFRFLDGQGQETRFFAALNELIASDALTKIGNRRLLEQEVSKFMVYCRRNQQPLCLMVMDVDNFRTINNTYGHATGDHALRELAARVAQVIRPEDIFCRDGGEEFVVAFPNLSLAESAALAQEILRHVSATPISFQGHTFTLTFSAGLVQWDTVADLEMLKKQADLLMYNAKQRGKNQIVVEER